MGYYKRHLLMVNYTRVKFSDLFSISGSHGVFNDDAAPGISRGSVECSAGHNENDAEHSTADADAASEFAQPACAVEKPAGSSRDAAFQCFPHKCRTGTERHAERGESAVHLRSLFERPVQEGQPPSSRRKRSVPARINGFSPVQRYR